MPLLVNCLSGAWAKMATELLLLLLLLSLLFLSLSLLLLFVVVVVGLYRSQRFPSQLRRDFHRGLRFLFADCDSHRKPSNG